MASPKEISENGHSAANLLPAVARSQHSHSTKLFVCTVCSMQYNLFQSLKRHRTVKHPNIAFIDSFLCECQREFDSAHGCSTHAAKCPTIKNRTNTPRESTYVAPARSSNTSHPAYSPPPARETAQLVCKGCGKCFGSTKGLSIHQARYCSNPPAPPSPKPPQRHSLTCVMCGKECASKAGLTNHQLRFCKGLSKAGFAPSPSSAANEPTPLRSPHTPSRSPHLHTDSLQTLMSPCNKHTLQTYPPITGTDHSSDSIPPTTLNICLTQLGATTGIDADLSTENEAQPTIGCHPPNAPPPDKNHLLSLKRAFDVKKPVYLPHLPQPIWEQLQSDIDMFSKLILEQLGATSNTWEDIERLADYLTDEIRRLVTDATRSAHQSKKAAETSPDERHDPISGRLAEARHRLEMAKQAHHRSAPYNKRDTWRHVRKCRRQLEWLNQHQEALRLQESFNRNEQRCVDTILNGPGTNRNCNIERIPLANYFAESHAPRSRIPISESETQHFLGCITSAFPTTLTEDCQLLTTISPEEVEAQIKRLPHRSAAGPDGIPYAVYKKLPAIHPVLVRLYHLCLQHKRIPSSWKKSTITLIYKRGDESDPRNWRPINLQNAIYKIYAAVFAKRLAANAMASGRISPTQKGFVPMNGCHEHGFIQTAVLNQTKRKRRKLYQVWYDLENAFGSVDHSLLLDILEAFKLPDAFIDIIRDIYHDAWIEVKTNEGFTPAIPNTRGVKQGCPLSPMLFNLFVEPLLRRLEEYDSSGIKFDRTSTAINHLAYADDLTVFCRDPLGIKQLHGIVERYLAWVQISANINKCSLLAITNTRNGRQLQDTSTKLELDGVSLPTISLQESYKYLGIATSMRRSDQKDQTVTRRQKVMGEIHLLFQSRLLSWQKLKALHTYLLPQLEFWYRNTIPETKELMSLDKLIRNLVRNDLRIGKQATTSFLYTNTANGGLGLVPVAEVAANTQLAHGLSMLNSNDRTVADIARNELLDVAHRRYNISPEAVDANTLATKFLNNSLQNVPGVVAKPTHGDVASIWSRIPSTAAKHKLEITISAEGVHLSHQSKPVPLKNLINWLRKGTQTQYSEEWQSKRDQGKTAAYYRHSANHWIRRPQYLKEHEYHFALRARLNLIPTNATLTRQRLSNDARCRHCKQQETLPHVLNHCPYNMDRVRQRHDTILERIRKATEHGNRDKKVLVNQKPPGYNDNIKPDLVVLDEQTKTATIVDLVIPFEDFHNNAFSKAHELKVAKYTELADWYRSRGYETQLDAIIYGSLGAIYHANLHVLTTLLGIQKKYAIQMQKFITVDLIRAATLIWCCHRQVK
jgi:hypothetical protein